MSLCIVWLRHDLRLADNPLFAFDSLPEHLVCVHVLDREWLSPMPGLGVPRMGPARLTFLWQSVMALRGELLKRGSDLLIRVGDPVDEVARLAECHGASEIRVRRDAGHDEADDVRALTLRLGGRVRISEHDSGMLFDTRTLPVDLESLPPTFSAFRRRVERDGWIDSPKPAPVTLPPWPDTVPRGLPALRGVCARAAAWQADPRGGYHFAGGEAAGHQRLEHVLWHSQAVARYKQTRNRLLGADFSTRFSAWLALGCLSARQIHQAMRQWEAEHGANESSYWIIFELLWRDYFHWAARQEGRALFGSRELPTADDTLRCWLEGRTGVPFIDAAMHELSATGWLSNRARQNVASYFVKDLGGDWRLGAAWFEHCLVDFDVASNWGNWRYVAGVGRDTRDRWFHVLKQAEQYDPWGKYVAHWQPSLLTLPAGRARHQPWRAAPDRFPPPIIVPKAWEDRLLAMHEPLEPDR